MPELLPRLAELTEKLNEQIVIDPVLFEQIVDSLPDGLLVINDQGDIQLCNKQIELLFGWPRANLIGQPVHILLPEALRERHAQHVSSYFGNPSVRPMREAQTLEGRNRSGRTIHVQITLAPVVSSHGVLALAVVRRVHGTRE